MKSASFVTLLLAVFALPGFAAPATVHTEGKVFIDDHPALAESTVLLNSVVRTEDGRAEIRMANSTLVLSENSSVRIIGDRTQILNGAAVIRTGKDAAAMLCEDSVTLSPSGTFRVELHPLATSQYGENECRFKVYEGSAIVQLASLTASLSSGQRMDLNRRCGDMIPSVAFSVNDPDALVDRARNAK